MTNKIHSLFQSEKGKKIYDKILITIKKNNMLNLIDSGVLLGLSGGADSVLLACFFYEYLKDKRNNIICVHINHMIRGEEAERDMLFSKEFSKNLGFEFISLNIDIPKIASKSNRGIEETARIERYNAFSNIISSRNDINAIAVAHNSTDNLETVIFNMFRGAGIRGISGIPPVRDNIIRPLICISKNEISTALKEFDIPFMYDSTNSSTEYTRNYIRNEILPKFAKLTSYPEDIVLRLCETARDNCFYIDSVVNEVFETRLTNDKISVDALRKLPAYILSEVLIQFAKRYGTSCEKTHIEMISKLLFGADFEYSLPNSKKFVLKENFCYISSEMEEKIHFSQKLEYGINEFEGINGVIIVSNEKINNSSSNVYRIAIQQKFKFDIINDGIFVRSKRDGDSYVYHGMTHKLKKMFNDRDIPISQRNLVPIICDRQGILWPIGFSQRDNSAPKNEEKCFYLALAYKIYDNSNKKFYFKQNTNIKKKGL